ncbi:flavoprotein [Streptomyces sp. NPDC056682]|uniref:flavoprotein n=1 Tax=Streptomyces sp. NPDC056682 TaxID=3345909 RepID=UPI0036822BFE
MRPIVHLAGCGSRPTEDLPNFASALRASGWNPYVVPTPVGRRFLDADRAEKCSGNVVHQEFDPDNPVELPRAHVVVVAPATFNTIIKLAAGVADTLPLAVAAEAIGAGLPVVCVPWANADLARHPLYAPALRTLDTWGVHLVEADQAEPFPWHLLSDHLEQIRSKFAHSTLNSTRREP